MVGVRQSKLLEGLASELEEEGNTKGVRPHEGRRGHSRQESRSRESPVHSGGESTEMRAVRLGR